MAVPAVAAGVAPAMTTRMCSHAAATPSAPRPSHASALPVHLSMACRSAAHCATTMATPHSLSTSACEGRASLSLSLSPSPTPGARRRLTLASPSAAMSGANSFSVSTRTPKGGGSSRDALGSCACAFLRRSLHSSFFDGGAASKAVLVLAYVAAQSSTTGRRGGGGGGLLGAEMNIFQRVVRIVRSYANALVSAAEDPEKLLDQTVLEMNEDLAKMRQASAQVLASQKQLENRYKAAETTSGDWYRRARLALEKGDEMLAKEALKRRKEYEDNAKALKSQLDQQKVVVEKLITNTRLLETKIQEARSRKDTLKARAQSAKTSQKVQQMLGSIDTSSALAAFEKMEEKVLALESEADAVAQIGTDDLSSKFALLEGDSVDEDLEALKKDMLGGGVSKRAGELPAGRSSTTSAESVGPFPFKDAELERELNELRRKAKEL